MQFFWGLDWIGPGKFVSIATQVLAFWNWVYIIKLLHIIGSFIKVSFGRNRESDIAFLSGLKWRLNFPSKHIKVWWPLNFWVAPFSRYNLSHGYWAKKNGLIKQTKTLLMIKKEDLSVFAGTWFSTPCPIEGLRQNLSQSSHECNASGKKPPKMMLFHLHNVGAFNADCDKRGIHWIDRCKVALLFLEVCVTSPHLGWVHFFELVKQFV